MPPAPKTVVPNPFVPQLRAHGTISAAPHAVSPTPCPALPHRSVIIDSCAHLMAIPASVATLRPSAVQLPLPASAATITDDSTYASTSTTLAAPPLLSTLPPAPCHAACVVPAGQGGHQTQASEGRKSPTSPPQHSEGSMSTASHAAGRGAAGGKIERVRRRLRRKDVRGQIIAEESLDTKTIRLLNLHTHLLDLVRQVEPIGGNIWATVGEEYVSGQSITRVSGARMDNA